MHSAEKIERIASLLERTLTSMRCVERRLDKGEVCFAGDIADRVMRVQMDPVGVARSWEFELFLEQSGVRPQHLASTRVLAADFHWVHAFGLSWLMPEAKWPNGENEFKVTASMVQWLEEGRPYIRIPLKLAGTLPESLHGLYRVPRVGQGMTTGEDAFMLELLGIWQAMGWHVPDADAGAGRRRRVKR